MGGVQPEQWRTRLGELLDIPGRGVEGAGGVGLGLRDRGTGQQRAVHAGEGNELASGVDHGDGGWRQDLAGLAHTGSKRLLGLVKGQ
jgi:hypothetical protein